MYYILNICIMNYATLLTEPADDSNPLTLCQFMQTLIVNVLGWCGPPRCNEDGSFADVQCCASSGECYCVDKDGKEIVGTRQHGHPAC